MVLKNYSTWRSQTAQATPSSANWWMKMTDWLRPMTISERCWRSWKMSTSGCPSIWEEVTGFRETPMWLVMGIFQNIGKRKKWRPQKLWPSLWTILELASRCLHFPGRRRLPRKRRRLKDASAGVETAETAGWGFEQLDAPGASKEEEGDEFYHKLKRTWSMWALRVQEELDCVKFATCWSSVLHRFAQVF